MIASLPSDHLRPPLNCRRCSRSRSAMQPVVPPVLVKIDNHLSLCYTCRTRVAQHLAINMCTLCVPQLSLPPTRSLPHAVLARSTTALPSRASLSSSPLRRAAHPPAAASSPPPCTYRTAMHSYNGHSALRQPARQVSFPNEVERVTSTLVNASMWYALACEECWMYVVSMVEWLCC